MKKIDLQQLETKYWSAELNEEERSFLYRSKSSDELSIELRTILHFLENEKQTTTKKQIDFSFLKSKQESKIIPMGNSRKKWIAIAASFTVLVFLGISIISKNNTPFGQNISEDEALSEVIKGLNIAAENLNKGFIDYQLGLKETEVFNLFTH